MNAACRSGSQRNVLCSSKWDGERARPRAHCSAPSPNSSLLKHDLAARNKLVGEGADKSAEAGALPKKKVIAYENKLESS